MRINIMLVDSLQEITLIKESISAAASGLEIKYATSLRNAQEKILSWTPDFILIGAGIMIMEGFEIVRNLRGTPIIILTETDRFLHLITDLPENIYSLRRAFDLNEIPLMLQKAVELFFIHKEKMKCT